LALYWQVNGRYKERGFVAEVLNASDVDLLSPLHEYREAWLHRGQLASRRSSLAEEHQAGYSDCILSNGRCMRGNLGSQIDAHLSG